MYICNSLLKHDYLNFSLTILEYCEPKKCLEREKHYWGLLNPEYNLAKDPNAPMSGRKHSPESIKKMSDSKIGLQAGEKNPFFGKFHSDETRKRLSEVNLGENHPFFGKKHSDETKQKMSKVNKRIMLGKKHPDEVLRKISEARLGQARPEGSGRPSQQILVIDQKTNLTTTYESISAAARALGIGKSTISKYIACNLQEPFKGQYIFQKL